MRPVLQIKTFQKYAKITIDLWSLPPFCDLDEQQETAIQKIIQNYILNHWSISRIRKQYYIVSSDLISFLCLKADASQLKDEIEKIAFSKINTNTITNSVIRN
jgi:hypothetical protein